jgi:HSP20 family molecular chaperone IbpA
VASILLELPSIMNAGTQRAPEPFRGAPSQQTVASRPSSICKKPNASAITRLCNEEKEPASIEIIEKEFEYQFSMPLSGIDPRRVYVFVTPHALLIEIRFKNMVLHQAITGAVIESINGQIVREFSLPAEIEQGATTVRLYEGTLQITARKSQQAQRTSWSQLVDFDAKPSLGRANSAACRS